MASKNAGDEDCPEAKPHKAAIQGYDIPDWVKESSWKQSSLPEKDRRYYEGIVEDFSLMLVACAGTGVSLRHIRSSFETHYCMSGGVDLARLRMENWRTLIISLRNYVDFIVHTVTGEVFIFPSSAARQKCPSHMQRIILATPTQPGGPKQRELLATSCKQVFLEGTLDTVDGALVDARVPNQSAQVATKEEIEAKIRPPPPPQTAHQSKKYYRGGKVAKSFEEQTAPKVVREMVAPVALAPIEKILDPEVANSNLDKLRARALERAKQEEEKEKLKKQMEKEKTQANGKNRRASSECGGDHDSAVSAARSRKMELGYEPVAEKCGPSQFFRKFRQDVKVAPIPCETEEERNAARKATQLRDTEYEIRMRQKLAEEEDARKRQEEEEDRQLREEEEERERGLREAEKLLLRDEMERRQRKMEEERRRALREAEELHRREEMERRRKKMEEEKQRALREAEEFHRREEMERRQRKMEEEKQRALQEAEKLQRMEELERRLRQIQMEDDYYARMIEKAGEEERARAEKQERLRRFAEEERAREEKRQHRLRLEEEEEKLGLMGTAIRVVEEAGATGAGMASEEKEQLTETGTALQDIKAAIAYYRQKIKEIERPPQPPPASEDRPVQRHQLPVVAAAAVAAPAPVRAPARPIGLGIGAVGGGGYALGRGRGRGIAAMGHLGMGEAEDEMEFGPLMVVGGRGGGRPLNPFGYYGDGNDLPPAGSGRGVRRGNWPDL